MRFSTRSSRPPASASSSRSSSSRPGSSSTSLASSIVVRRSPASRSSWRRCSSCAACPPFVYRRLAERRSQLVAAGLLQATSLSIPVVAGQIGVDLGLIRPENYVALVTAGLISVIVFPLVSLTLLRVRPATAPASVVAPSDARARDHRGRVRVRPRLLPAPRSRRWPFTARRSAVCSSTGAGSCSTPSRPITAQSLRRRLCGCLAALHRQARSARGYRCPSRARRRDSPTRWTAAGNIRGTSVVLLRRRPQARANPLPERLRVRRPVAHRALERVPVG